MSCHDGSTASKNVKTGKCATDKTTFVGMALIGEAFKNNWMTELVETIENYPNSQKIKYKLLVNFQNNHIGLNHK